MACSLNRDQVLDLYEVIYGEIALAEVKETMEQLLKDGIVRISGYNDEGEPLFVLTELGKQVKKELGNQ